MSTTIGATTLLILSLGTRIHLPSTFDLVVVAHHAALGRVTVHLVAARCGCSRSMRP
jgi:hypothetical protein